MNRKQTITIIRATGQQLFELLSFHRLFQTQQLHARPAASSSSFAAAKTVKCFACRYCQPPKGRASNRIWWLHTDRSSCCCCSSSCCTFPTSAHESGHGFYCLLYYCISRVAYALNIACPFADPLFGSLLRCLCLFAADFSADFYVQRLLCFAFSRLFLTPCFMRRSLVLRVSTGNASFLEVFCILLPLDSFFARFFFACWFFSLLFSTIVNALFAFPCICVCVFVCCSCCFWCLGFWFLFCSAFGYLWDICKCVGSYLCWGFVLAPLMLCICICVLV